MKLNFTNILTTLPPETAWKDGTESCDISGIKMFWSSDSNKNATVVS